MTLMDRPQMTHFLTIFKPPPLSCRVTLFSTNLSAIVTNASTTFLLISWRHLWSTSNWSRQGAAIVFWFYSTKNDLNHTMKQPFFWTLLVRSETFLLILTLRFGSGYALKKMIWCGEVAEKSQMPTTSSKTKYSQTQL